MTCFISSKGSRENVSVICEVNVLIMLMGMCTVKWYNGHFLNQYLALHDVLTNLKFQNAKSVIFDIN